MLKKTPRIGQMQGVMSNCGVGWSPNILQLAPLRPFQAFVISSLRVLQLIRVVGHEVDQLNLAVLQSGGNVESLKNAALVNDYLDLAHTMSLRFIISTGSVFPVVGSFCAPPVEEKASNDTGEK